MHFGIIRKLVVLGLGVNCKNFLQQHTVQNKICCKARAWTSTEGQLSKWWHKALEKSLEELTLKPASCCC